MAGEAEQGHVFMLACLAQKAKKYAIARTAWEKYIAARTFDPKAHYNLGVCLDALGERAAALHSFERAFELQPSMADAGANAAGLLIQTGEAERACTFCYLALKGDPECAAALYNLNTALRMAGRHGEAVAFAWRWIRDKLVSGPARRASAALSATIAAIPPSNDHVKSLNTGIDSAPSPPPPPPPPPSLPPPPIAVHTGSRGRTDALDPDVGGVADRGAGSSVSDAACREGEEGGPLTVACVRWGRKYGPEYVERLAAGVRRHLRRDHLFVCYTDDVEALRWTAGIEARPLGTGCEEWRGWWHKAFLFSREAGLAGRVLYLDLDTVVVGSLGDVAGYSGTFAALSVEGMVNELRPTGLNSSVMSWDASREAPTVRAVHGLLKEAYAVITSCVHKLDHWLEMTVPGVTTLQRAFPGQIVEYNSMRAAVAKDSAGSDGNHLLLLPRDARVICFPLEPKPHRVKEEWLQLLWRGGDGGGGGAGGSSINDADGQQY
ncbi:unnamed protein product [Pylaiella littoralis]